MKSEINIDLILNQLHALSNPTNVAIMAHYGINPGRTLGIMIPALRKMAKEIGINHPLAQALWDSDLHEARLIPGKEYKHGEN